jgi:hypothetical protein
VCRPFSQGSAWHTDENIRIQGTSDEQSNILTFISAISSTKLEAIISTFGCAFRSADNQPIILAIISAVITTKFTAHRQPVLFTISSADFLAKLATN